MPETANGRSANLMVIMGIFWLLLAGGLFFYQIVTPPTVRVEWETATELDTAGFFLYRSLKVNGEFVQVNQTMINSEGNALTGAAYHYVDQQVKPGETYYYLLEEVQKDARTNRYEEDIFAYTVPRVTWWALLLTAVTALIGLALLVSGIREGGAR